MKLNNIIMNMHTCLSKGMMPEFTFESWILIYAALNAFIKIIESHKANEYPEDSDIFDMDVTHILREYEKGTTDEIL